MTQFAVVSRSETALPLRTREKGGDVSDPPKNRGVMRSFVEVGCDIPLLGPMTGRSRPHLSLREGSETPLSPRALLCRIGPRRQGFASPLRALDGSGPIRKTRCSRGERGGRAVGREGESLVHDKGYYHSCLGRSRKLAFGHTRRLEPQPWGAVTRRAVAQRRSRAGGLTRRSA